MTTTIARAIHPGELLRDELEERNISQKEFALLIGKTPAELNHVIRGERGINADFAMRLSIIFETSPTLWLNLQNQRDLYCLQKLESKKPIFATIRKNVTAFQKAAAFA